MKGFHKTLLIEIIMNSNLDDETKQALADFITFCLTEGDDIT